MTFVILKIQLFYWAVRVILFWTSDQRSGDMNRIRWTNERREASKKYYRRRRKALTSVMEYSSNIPKQRKEMPVIIIRSNDYCPSLGPSTQTVCIVGRRPGSAPLLHSCSGSLPLWQISRRHIKCPKDVSVFSSEYIAWLRDVNKAGLP